MTRASSHTWSREDPGEKEFRQSFLNAHFQTLKLFLWVLEWEQPHVPVHGVVGANVHPEAKGAHQTRLRVRHRCRTAVVSVWKPSIHILSPLCSLSGVKLILFIATVLVFFCFFLMWSHGGTFTLFFPAQWNVASSIKRWRTIWVCTCTSRAPVDSLDNGFHFYLNMF